MEEIYLNNNQKNKLLFNSEYLNNEFKINYFTITNNIIFIIQNFEILDQEKILEEKWNVDKNNNVQGYNIKYIDAINKILYKHKIPVLTLTKDKLEINKHKQDLSKILSVFDGMNINDIINNQLFFYYIKYCKQDKINQINTILKNRKKIT